MPWLAGCASPLVSLCVWWKRDLIMDRYRVGGGQVNCSRCSGYQKRMIGGTESSNMEGLVHPPPGSIRATQQEMKGGWLLIATLLIGIATIFSNLYATQPILPILSQSLDVSPALSALTVSAPRSLRSSRIRDLWTSFRSCRTQTCNDRAACLLLLPTSLAALAVNLPMHLFHQRRIIGVSLMALAFFFTFISIFT